MSRPMSMACGSQWTGDGAQGKPDKVTRIHAGGVRFGNPAAGG
jgi:hypothetical protein